MSFLLGAPVEQVAQAVAGDWRAAEPLPLAGSWAPPSGGAVPIAGGKVLLAGGEDGDRTARAGTVVFDPTTNAWEVTGSLHVARRLHTTTRLADGRVLVTGGITGRLTRPVAGIAAAEIYDPTTATWTLVAGMSETRFSHSATLLPDGRVLIAGGTAVRSTDSHRALRTTEIFDPVTGSWSPAEPMTEARFGHPAVPLVDGRVLVAGGIVPVGVGLYAPLALCELYDPGTGRWTPTGNLAVARKSHQATRLADGTVLVSGGDGRGLAGWVYEPYSQSATEVFDPATGLWSRAADMGWGRSHHRDVLLTSGKVLQVGGIDDGSFDVGYRNAAIYDPTARSWTAAAAPAVGRYAFAVAPFDDGRVLIAGGVTRSGAAGPGPDSAVVTATAEIFTPGDA